MTWADLKKCLAIKYHLERKIFKHSLSMLAFFQGEIAFQEYSEMKSVCGNSFRQTGEIQYFLRLFLFIEITKLS